MGKSEIYTSIICKIKYNFFILFETRIKKIIYVLLK